MATPTLSVPAPETFHKVHSAIVSAVVRLNFNEPKEALDLLLDALTEINFARVEEVAHVR
jgi:hypothetical protein